MGSRLKATPRLSAESAALELERPLGAHLTGGRPLGAHFHAPEGLVLLRELAGLTGYFSGSLSSLSLEDVLSHVLSGVRTGLLVVQSGAVRRTVSFRDGQVVFASSSERHERLGACLVRLGLITDEQLHQALTRVAPGTKIGQALTREGLLTEARLYNGLTFLIRELVLDLFEMTEGAFLFLEGVSPGSDAVKLPERTRDLVLAGLQRGQAAQNLRRRFPDTLLVLAPEALLGGKDEALFARARSAVTLQALRPHFEGSTFAFLSWVEERVRDGSLVIQAAAGPASTVLTEPEAQGPEERYAALLALVVESLRMEGKASAFLSTPPPELEEAFAGVTLSGAGVLDLERLRANLRVPDERLSRARLLEALDAFVAYALFAANNVLPREMAERLTRAHRALQESGR